MTYVVLFFACFFHSGSDCMLVSDMASIFYVLGTILSAICSAAKFIERCLIYTLNVYVWPSSKICISGEKDTYNFTEQRLRLPGCNQDQIADERPSAIHHVND